MRYTLDQVNEIIKQARETGAVVDLTGARLTGARLTDADLAGADLTYARLTGADLTHARLTGADLTGADLTGARLTYARLMGADLTGADLTDANLTYARLTGARLTGADLTDVVGDGRYIKTIMVEKYSIAYTADVLQIGCEQHPIADWWSFSDRRIVAMDGRGALEWWKKWRPVLHNIIELSPAESTTTE